MIKRIRFLIVTTLQDKIKNVHQLELHQVVNILYISSLIELFNQSIVSV